MSVIGWVATIACGLIVAALSFFAGHWLRGSRTQLTEAKRDLHGRIGGVESAFRERVTQLEAALNERVTRVEVRLAELAEELPRTYMPKLEMVQWMMRTERKLDRLHEEMGELQRMFGSQGLGKPTLAEREGP